ncbi:hypothetical protein D9M71_828720 [compost metagenome]
MSTASSVNCHDEHDDTFTSARWSIDPIETAGVGRARGLLTPDVLQGRGVLAVKAGFQVQLLG